MRNIKRKALYIQHKAKKQKLAHYAQRKFASVIPASPIAKVYASPSQNSDLLKVEDFIDFLCMRGTPIMPQELEVFAESAINLPEKISLWQEDFGEKDVSVTELVKVSFEKRVEKLYSTENQHCMLEAPEFCATLAELNDFLVFIKDKVEDQTLCIFSIIPSEHFVLPSYADESIKVSTKTTHIHRLKKLNCDNSVKLECIKRQLQKENITFKDIPKIGSCELDLPLLCDTVELFGGVEAASNLHWKSIADHLSIPKNVGRRIAKLEDIYLKYVLPFTVLPNSEKKKSYDSVLGDKQCFIDMPNQIENKKSISVNTFQRIANNIKYMYLPLESNSKETETLFWNHVSEGNRHIAALSANIGTSQVPFSTEVSNTSLNLQVIFSAKDSILKHVGKIEDLTVPRLLYESLFSTSKWTVQSNGFNTLSYIHFGADKIWYVVPNSFASLFEEMSSKSKGCLLEPSGMISKGIPIVRCVQKVGQWIVVTGGCYYLNVSTGYCFSETVCFATQSWFSSHYFQLWEPTLRDCLPIKVLLSFVTDNFKNNLPRHISVIFIEKLRKFKDLIEDTQKSVMKIGIREGNMKLKWKNVITCQSCNMLCFPFYGRDKENKEKTFCIIETLNMVESKKLPASRMLCESLVSMNEIERVLRRLKNNSI